MSTQQTDLHYPSHSAQALGQDYVNHVMAMTREALHNKSDIAIQLAWRDAELRRLRGEHGVLVALLREADDVLETIMPESTEEGIMLDDLRRDIAKAVNQA